MNNRAALIRQMLTYLAGGCDARMKEHIRSQLNDLSSEERHSLEALRSIAQKAFHPRAMAATHLSPPDIRPWHHRPRFWVIVAATLLLSILVLGFILIFVKSGQDQGKKTHHEEQIHQGEKTHREEQIHRGATIYLEENPSVSHPSPKDSDLKVEVFDDNGKLLDPVQGEVKIIKSQFMVFRLLARKDCFTYSWMVSGGKVKSPSDEEFVELRAGRPRILFSQISESKPVKITILFVSSSKRLRIPPVGDNEFWTSMGANGNVLETTGGIPKILQSTHVAEPDTVLNEVFMRFDVRP